MSLTDLSVVELAEEIRTRGCSALEVVDAHIERIELVDGQLNAVVVPLFADARAAAARADERFSRGEELGPLHGVPFTLKECFDVAGVPTTLGVPALAKVDPPKRDGLLVRRMRDAGAIVLGKTNLPQLMWFNEADNPVFGRTNNPWDLDRGPGGSSGGEAAIIAARGSPLGFGTDSGGSIRTPAHFCGVHTLKPTSGRLSLLGTADDRMMAGQEAIIDQPGPLARRVEDLRLVLDVVGPASSAYFDPAVPPVAWRDASAVSVERLRVGVFTSGGPISSAPAVRRVVEEAAAALENDGAHVQAISPPGLDELKERYDRMFSADGGVGLDGLLGESDRDWRISRILDLQRDLGPLSASAYFDLVAERTRYRACFIELLDANQIDVIVSPPYALAAIPHGASGNAELEASEILCAVFNVVGFPAGVVAASRVQPGEEFEPSHAGVARSVDQGSAGLPVGVHVAARHWREDIVLAVMGRLEEHFREQDSYPIGPPP